MYAAQGPAAPQKVDRVPLPFPSSRELLSGYSGAESGCFHSLCIERRILRDVEAFRQGDPPDGICVLKKGLLKIVSISEKGTEQSLHILRPGDVFGEMILIGASRETVTLLIHKFEEIGLLRREGRDLFLNRERLADYLGLEGG